MERCGGMGEGPWQGTPLVEGETRLAGATRMPWQRLQPVGAWSRQGEQNGRARGKNAMQEVESRLARHPDFPKWAMLIRPVAAW
jgi:hypothetical protein